jgi:hypothetical protein
MFNPGDHVKIVRWAVENEGPYASKDRQVLVGKTGTVVMADSYYVSVKLDPHPDHVVESTVLAVESELEHYEVQDQAQSA